MTEQTEWLLWESLRFYEGDFSDTDIKDIKDYLEHGEYGVAYDLIVFLLEKMQLCKCDSIKAAAKNMGYK